MSYLSDQVNNGHSSPNGIEVAIHYYCQCCIHPRWSAPAVQDAVSSLVDEGMMIESGQNGSGYKFTPKGQAWISMICATPFPRSSWVDPRTGRHVEFH